jgi:flagellum-specific peptidoglycan hydrolase FlgJ
MITQIKEHLTAKGLTPEAIRTITCQAAHESAFWNSALYHAVYNMFGMKSHGRKVSGKTNEVINGYAAYQDYKGSLNDIVDWCRRTGATSKAEDIIEYSHFLKTKGYYEDSEENYTAGLINAYKKLFPESFAKYNKPYGS